MEAKKSSGKQVVAILLLVIGLAPACSAYWAW